jgi:hypothetical protein
MSLLGTNSVTYQISHEPSLGRFYNCFLFSLALQPSAGYGFVITHNDAPQSVGLLWTSDQLNTHNRQTLMPPVGFETTIAVGERPQT